MKVPEARRNIADGDGTVTAPVIEYWVSRLDILESRQHLQPLAYTCPACHCMIVEEYGDLCPGCEDRVRIETRSRLRDQAALGKWF